LRRFIQRFGPEALLDTESRVYRDAGLRYLRMDRDEMAERLLANAGLLRLPLIRAGSELSVGSDEAAWKRIASADPGTL
jgi:arsenate reductase (glutaredoxin)